MRCIFEKHKPINQNEKLKMTFETAIRDGCAAGHHNLGIPCALLRDTKGSWGNMYVMPWDEYGLVWITAATDAAAALTEIC